MSVTTRWHPALGTPGNEPAPPDPPRRPRSWSSWLLTIAALAVLTGAAWLVSHSPLFHARSISVTGNRHLSHREVLDLAGVDGTTNVLWFSPGGVEATLERSPWVQTATVSRSLPSTISISIRERTAVAVLQGGERRSLVAPDGTVLGPASATARLPLIERSSLDPTGSRATGPVLVALRAVGAAPAALRHQVRRVFFGADGGMVIELASGVRALYGDGTQLSEKGQALEAVLAWASRHGVALVSIDVSAPVTPSARPVVPASPAPPVLLSPATATSPSPAASPTPTPTRTPTSSP
jgi:cell division protein FtsQ